MKINAGTASRLRTLPNEAKLAYIKLNIQTPCPPRGAVPVNTGAWLGDFSLSTPGSLSVMDATVPAMFANVAPISIRPKGIDLAKPNAILRSFPF